MRTRCAGAVSAILLPAILACVTTTAAAGVVATEDFESYGTGAFANGSSGGTGWASGWVIPGVVAPTVEASGLSYSGGAITINGGTRRLRQDVSAVQTGAFFPAMRALDIVQTGTVYMSLLVRPVSVEDDDFYQFGLSDTNDNPEGSVLIDSPATNSQYRVRNGTSGGSNLGVTVTDNVTALLVLKVHKISSNYTVTGFVNPTSLTEGDNLSVTPGAVSGYSQISHWVFRAARIETTDEIEIDQIRIATTFSEAIVPEPATCTFLGTGLVAALLRRRRTRRRS